MKYIIGILVGAVIGYITNWLAIKMLFRPHEEKRIFGIKVPFTPGLIPKERKRIAKSVGEAIGAHLLTKETILNSLCSDKIKEALSGWIKGEVKKLETSDSTLEENLKSLLNGHYEEIKGDLEKNITAIVVEEVKGKEFKSKVTSIVRKEIGTLLNNSPKAVLSSQAYENIRLNLINNLNQSMENGAIKENILNLISGKLEGIKENTLEEIIPPTVIGNLKVYMYNKRHEIGKYIQGALKEEKYEIKIKGIISNILSTQLNPMIAMFVNSDTIYNKIVDGASEMLETEETLVDIVLILNEVLTKVTKTKVIDILENIPASNEEQENLVGKKLWEFLLSNVKEHKIINTLIEGVESDLNNSDTLGAVFNKAGINLEEELVNFVENKLDMFLESYVLESSVSKFLTSSLQRILNTEMKFIFQKEGRDLSSKVSAITLDLYSTFVENKASDFIELFNISKVVEEKINEFEVTYAEEIILEIASKELSAITWLGAVLGAVMGILTPVLSALY